MSAFKKFILIVLLALITLVTVYVYFIFLNTGQLKITTDGKGDYGVSLDEVGYPCFSDPCLLKLKAGNYEIKIDKAGFYPYSAELEIKRAGETNLKPELEEIPQLRISTFSKEVESKPTLPGDKNILLGGIWNTEKNAYLFLDEEDEKLKIRRNGKETQLVTTLKKLTPPLEFFWSPDGQKVIVADGKEIYLIRTELGSRNKVITDFNPVSVIWTENSALLNSESNEVYMLDLESFKEIKKTNIRTDLKASFPISSNQLIAYREVANTTQIIIIELNSGNESVLTERLDFPVDDIYYDSDLFMAYFRESNSQNWYEIKIRQ